MNPLFLTLLAVIIVGFVGIFWFLSRKRERVQDNQTILMLQNQIYELTRTLDAKMGESSRFMQESVRSQFSESQKLLSDISHQMRQSLQDVVKEQTRTNEVTRQFVTIAEQLANLEKVLKHQKQRGNLGEAALELILSNMLGPELFQMQYQFKNGEIVDAVIHTRDGVIPVDAKFSLDNYERLINATDDTQKEELEKEFKNDLKKRIDETAKYVRPEEGTLPFAFMFIPAEAIYYDLLINEVGSVKVNTRNLIDYAYNEKKVVIVSPTTFQAYLKSVLYGFKAYKIEQTAQDIIKQVDKLGNHLSAYEQYMQKLGTALSTTVSHYSTAYKELKKIDKDVLHITGTSPGIEPIVLAKPNMDDDNE